MNKSLAGLASILGVCAGLSAQGFTSPIGLEKLEGNGISANNYGSFTASRMQYCDGNQRGAPKPIGKVSFRRDAYTAPLTSAGARTLDLGFVMAHTDVSVAAPSTTFATNYKGGLSSQVFTVKSVNLPDLNAQPGVLAPFNITLPFDTPFVYNGNDDLLWEVTGKNNTNTGAYYLDTQTNGTTAGGGIGSGIYLGWQGCTVPGKTVGFDIIYPSFPVTDAANVSTVRLYATGGPNSSPGILAIGLSDPNLAGLFCAPLRTSADIVIPVSTDATGNIATSAAPIALSFPFPGASQFDLYAQFAALDTAVPALYLSDAFAGSVVPYSAPVVRKVYAVRNTTSDVAASGSASTFAIVVKFE